MADRAIDIDVEDLTRCPTEPEDWAVTVVVGGIAPLLSFPIVPPFVVSGYPVRAVRTDMDGGTEPRSSMTGDRYSGRGS